MHPSGFVLFFRNKFQELFQDSSRTLIFPRLQISLRSFHSHFIFSTFQNKFSLRSTYISYNVGSENFLAWVKQISRTFPGPVVFFQDFPVMEKGQNNIPGLSRFFRTCASSGPFEWFNGVFICHCQKKNFWMDVEEKRCFRGTEILISQD